MISDIVIMKPDHGETMMRVSSAALAHLRLRHLQLVETLVDRGSLHKAAKALNMSQPSASAMLQDIERALGTTLFARTPQGVTLTHEGTIAFARLRAIVGELRMLTQEAQASVSLPIVRVGAALHTFFGVLQDVLTTFLHRIPCRLDLSAGNASVLFKNLEQDEVDCIVGRMPPGWIESFSVREFFYESLYEAEFCIASAPSHHLARARKITFDDLANELWILPKRGSYIHYLLGTAFASAGLPPPKVQIETSAFLRLPLLHASGCLTVADRDSTRDQQRQGLVRILPIKLPDVQVPVAFVARRSAMMNPNVLAFWEELKAAVAARGNGARATVRRATRGTRS